MPHTGHTEPTPTISAYVSSLAQQGKEVIPGMPGTFWAQYESLAMMRIPDFVLSPPSPGEVERLLWRGRIAVATYLRHPDGSHPANAWLYVCRNKSYRIEDLCVAGRRDARRASRSLRIDFIDWPTVLEHGFPAYSQSRQRVGLSDDTLGHFQSRLTRFSGNSCHRAIGAWTENKLIAFMALIVVDDWVAIEGSFSTNDDRTLCPNDGLASFLLRYFLVERDFTTVTYGLSSIQELNQSGGLHTYKKKVGFEAHPVHRAFVLHPLVRPFANQLALKGANIIKHVFPRNRLVKKASGMLSLLVGGEPLMDSLAGSNVSRPN
jgi:hypothetical protein